MSANLARAYELTDELREVQTALEALAAERDGLVLQLRRDGLSVREVAYLFSNSPAWVQQVTDRARKRETAAHEAAWASDVEVTRTPAGLADDWEAVREAHYLRCENATRGAMLNRDGRAADVNPALMLSSSRMTARYGSDELVEYLQTDPPPRHNAKQARAARTTLSRAW